MVSEQNRVPFSPRRGALTDACKTPPNRLLAPELTAPCVRAAPQTFFRRSNLQNGANDGLQKVLSTDNPILFRKSHRVYPALCFDFINYPISAILHPILFTCKTRGDTETDDISPQPSCGRSRAQLATWRLSCDHSSTANIPAHKDPAPMQPHCEEWWHGGESADTQPRSGDTQPRSGARTKRLDQIVICCFVTLTLVKNLEPVVTQRCWSPRKIRKIK